jgi:hypothetical protein
MANGEPLNNLWPFGKKKGKFKNFPFFSLHDPYLTICHYRRKFEPGLMGMTQLTICSYGLIGHLLI